MKLTPRQEAILNRMKRRNMEQDGPETGREMVDALWGTGLFTSFEQGQVVCKQLVAKGLVEPLGFGPLNARCYGPVNTNKSEADDAAK